MRNISPSFKSIVRSNKLRVALLVEATFSSGPINLWSGYGSLTYSGITYAGAGTLLNMSQVTETLSTKANGFRVQLSGINSDILSIALAEPYTGRPFKAKIALIAPDPDQETTFKITVANDGGGNKYYVEDFKQGEIELKYGNKYNF